MAKKNKKVNKQPTRRQRRPRRKNANSHAQMVKHVCAVTDPFCEHAEGAYSPWGSNQRTVPFTFRGYSAFGSGAGGDAIIYFGAERDEYLCGASTTTTFAPAGVLPVQVGTTPSFITQARLVSAGIRWWTPIAATSAGGAIAVIPITDPVALLATSTTTAEFTNTPGTVITDLRQPGTFVFSPRELTYREFGTMGATTTAPTTEDFNGVVLAITGPASSDVIIVQWEYHFEGLLDTTVGLSLGRQVKPKPHVNQILGMLDNMFGHYSGSPNSVSRMIYNKASSAVGALIRQAGSAAISRLLPPVGAALAIMDVD